MAESEDRRKNRLTSGEPLCPFDFLNNTAFYDPEPRDGTEYWDRLMAQAEVACAAHRAASRGLRFAFYPGAASNGYEGYVLAEENKDKILANTKARTGEAYLTTQRLKHNVAASEMLDRVILPNRIANEYGADRAETMLPDMAVIGVFDFEGAVRTARQNDAMSQGATFQDAIFESWWVPQVIDSSCMVLGGDHAYSRYANVEEITADQIQCGLLDDVRDEPGADYDVVDLKGRQVTLADRAWETARHIVDVVEKGFRTDLAVAALVVRFQLDDWLRNGGGSIDMDRVHPVLRDRKKSELKRMDRLKEIMLPYLAAKCAAWMPYDRHDGLKSYFETNVLPAAEKFDPACLESLKTELTAYQPRGGFNNPAYAGLSSNFAKAARAEKRRGADADYFRNPAALFDDRHFDKLSVWEQASLGFVLGSMEAHRLPENAPRAAFYACDPKGGERARQWADERGVEWLREAQNASDPVSEKDSFYQRVIVPNVLNACAAVVLIPDEKAMEKRRVRNIVSTLDILDIDRVVQENRNFVAAKGSDRWSSKARLALQMEWFDRNAEILVLRPGWQNHPHEVQMAVRAVLHATGLVKKAYPGGAYRMEIFVDGEDGLKKQTLYDLVKTLGETVEASLDRTPPAPDQEHYLAMARLLEITDKLADPGRMNVRYRRDPQTGATKKEDIIKWRHVDSDLTGFWHTDPSRKAELSAAQPGAAGESFRDRLRRKLLDKGVQFFEPEDLQGLNEDYERAWLRHNAMNEEAQRRLYESRTTFIEQKGPV